MSTARSWALAVVLLSSGVVLAQSADIEATCSHEAFPGMPEGPIHPAYYEADSATARRACPRTEAGLGVQGGAVIDTPNFYGDLEGALVASGSWAFRPDWELYATLEAVRAEYVQNASLKGTELHLGQLTVGATHVLLAEHGWTLSPTARLMLPTSTATRDVRVMGLDLGLAAQKQLRHRLDVFGFLGVDGSLGISSAPSEAVGGVLANVGIEMDILRWLGVAVDVNAHFGHRAPLDYVAPALALRFAAGQHFGAELGASLPVAGADRHDVIGDLRFTYRL